jgi:hypothetical protein
MLVRCPMHWLAAGLLTLTPVLSAQENVPSKAEASKAALKNLIVYPAQITLDGPRDEQRIGVLGEYADGRAWDLSRDAAIVSSNPKVALVDGGVVRPVAERRSR